MSNSLTKKEKGFVQDYVKTGNGTLAASNNYDVKDDNSAAVIASKGLRKAKIQKAIKPIAEQIPDRLLVEVHNEGLQASKKVFKNNNESGEIEEVSEEPDYAVRHKYLDSAYKLKGTYAPEKTENKTVVNVVSPESLALAKEYEEKLKKKL